MKPQLAQYRAATCKLVMVRLQPSTPNNNLNEALREFHALNCLRAPPPIYVLRELAANVWGISLALKHNPPPSV